MTDGWYPPARTDLAHGGDAGDHLGPVTVGVLHTTESPVGKYRPSGTDYGHFGHTNYPHFTADVQDGKFVAFQHISIRQAAKALKNQSGGVQTNKQGCIQIEVVGSATMPFTDREVLTAGLAELMRWIEDETDIPRQSTVTFKAYPASAGARNGVRLTGDQWNAYRGWLGHQHVPENEHGDPGAIDIKKLLGDAEAAPTLQEDDIYAIVSDPRTGMDFGTNGVQKFIFGNQQAKNDWARAFGAKRVTLSQVALDAIPTVAVPK